jgi:hypothetical protein
VAEYSLLVASSCISVAGFYLEGELFGAEEITCQLGRFFLVLGAILEEGAEFLVSGMHWYSWGQVFLHPGHITWQMGTYLVGGNTLFLCGTSSCTRGVMYCSWASI